MSDLEKLKRCTSLKDVAGLLGYKPKALSYIIYKIPSEKKYVKFAIPKKSGGERRIKAPTEQLRNLQRRLSGLLSNCYEEISEKAKDKRPLSHGFRRGHCIFKNAEIHRNKRHVFNVDLQDFFPSINFGRVRGYFMKNAHFTLNEKVATIIAQIACDSNELPQGSPCSPIISNLIGHILDVWMAKLAQRSHCRYSRYADDLTFSTSKKVFPEMIARVGNENGNQWTSGKTLRKEVKRLGFAINESKTSLQHRAARQVVTGLVVNEKVNIKKEYYRLTRSMCHTLFETGEFYIGKKVAEQALPVDVKTAGNETEAKDRQTGTVNQLEGRLSYIHQVKKQYEARKPGDRRNKPTSFVKLYTGFLFYKHFFALDRPLIVLEGKTDITYFKCAMKQLRDDYRELVEENGGRLNLKIGFLNLSDNVREVFAVAEGTSGLASLMDIYEKHMKPFKRAGKEHPVIIVVDNDRGSDEIKKRLGPDKKDKPFCLFRENLYVVHIPLGSNGESRAVEDLFDNTTLSTKVDGKTFSRAPKIDTKTEYGKIVFAEKVIRARQDAISFEGFKGVLDLVVKVIEEHRGRAVEKSAAADKAPT